MAEKSLWERIQRIDRRVIYTIVLISTAIILIRPLGLPVPISESTRAVYDYIESLPAGSYILWDIGIGGPTYAELAPASAAVMNHILIRPLKLVLVTLSADAPPLIDLMIKTLVKIPSDKSYGKDWVFMGYVAGAESGRAALAKDFRSTVPKDYLGTPIDQIPMLAGVTGASNFKLVMDTTGGTDTVEHFIRQWVTPFGAKYASVLTAGIVPAAIAYYPRQLFGFLYGARGGAEYELLIKMPGRNLMMTDAISIVHVWFFIFVAIGNIGYIAIRMQKKKT